MDWQTVVALCLVALAGLALLPRFFKLFRKPPSAGCGNCGGCSVGKEKIIQKPLIGLSEITNKHK